jgi:hypothetical protein
VGPRALPGHHVEWFAEVEGLREKALMRSGPKSAPELLPGPHAAGRSQAEPHQAAADHSPAQSTQTMTSPDRPQVSETDAASPASRRRRIRDYALALFNKFNNDTTMSLVAMVSFNVLTSVVPLILALITAVALLPVVSHNVPELAAQIDRILPADLQKDANIARLLTSIHSASRALTLVSIVSLLWGGMNLFSSIECAFAFIFRVKTRDLVPQKLMSLVMILLFVVLLPLSFVASIVLGTATTRLGSILPS